MRQNPVIVLFKPFCWSVAGFPIPWILPYHIEHWDIYTQPYIMPLLLTSNHAILIYSLFVKRIMLNILLKLFYCFFIWSLFSQNSDVPTTQWFPQITQFKVCKRLSVFVSPYTYLLSLRECYQQTFPKHINSSLYLPA